MNPLLCKMSNLSQGAFGSSRFGLLGSTSMEFHLTWFSKTPSPQLSRYLFNFSPGDPQSIDWAVDTGAAAASVASPGEPSHARSCKCTGCADGDALEASESGHGGRWSADEPEPHVAGLEWRKCVCVCVFLWRPFLHLPLKGTRCCTLQIDAVKKLNSSHPTIKNSIHAVRSCTFRPKH